VKNGAAARTATERGGAAGRPPSESLDLKILSLEREKRTHPDLQRIKGKKGDDIRTLLSDKKMGEADA